MVRFVMQEVRAAEQPLTASRDQTPAAVVFGPTRRPSSVWRRMGREGESMSILR